MTWGYRVYSLNPTTTGKSLVPVLVVSPPLCIWLMFCSSTPPRGARRRFPSMPRCRPWPLSNHVVPSPLNHPPPADLAPGSHPFGPFACHITVPSQPTPFPHPGCFFRTHNPRLKHDRPGDRPGTPSYPGQSFPKSPVTFPFMPNRRGEHRAQTPYQCHYTWEHPHPSHPRQNNKTKSHTRPLDAFDAFDPPPN